MNVFCEGISVDIPSRKREIGRRQGKKAPADAENMVKYPGQSTGQNPHAMKRTKGMPASESCRSPF